MLRSRRRAQAVGGAEIAERFAFEFRNPLEHHVVIFLADVERDMAGAAFFLGALG